MNGRIPTERRRISPIPPTSLGRARISPRVPTRRILSDGTSQSSSSSRSGNDGSQVDSNDGLTGLTRFLEVCFKPNTRFLDFFDFLVFHNLFCLLNDHLGFLGLTALPPEAQTSIASECGQFCLKDGADTSGGLASRPCIQGTGRVCTERVGTCCLPP